MDSNKTLTSKQDSTKRRALLEGEKKMSKKEQLEKLGWTILDSVDQKTMRFIGGETYLEMSKSGMSCYRAHHEDRNIYWGHVGRLPESEYIEKLWDFEDKIFGNKSDTEEESFEEYSEESLEESTSESTKGVWESARGKSVTDFKGYRSFLGMEERDPSIGFASSYVNHTLKVVLSVHMGTPNADLCKKYIEDLFSTVVVEKPEPDFKEGFKVEEFPQGLDYYSVDKMKPQWLNFLLFKDGEIMGSLRDYDYQHDIYAIDFQYQVVFPKLDEKPSKKEVYEARKKYIESKQAEIIYPTVNTKQSGKVELIGVEEPQGIRAFVYPVGEKPELGLTLVGKESVVNKEEEGHVFAINTLSKQAYVRSEESYFDKEESTWAYGILCQAEKNIIDELEELKC